MHTPDHSRIRTSLRRGLRLLLQVGAIALTVTLLALGATTVPTDIKMPGTQPTGVDNPPILSSVGNCGCHGNFSGNPRPEDVPEFGWQGGMMGNAGRDPLFWATVAIAEQDFDGVGDLCLKCHSVKGWLEGRSTPTNGSALDPNTDAEGVMCHFCHLMVDPDEANNIPNPAEGAYVEEQNAPFFAHDETTGEGYYGGAEFVLNSGDTRLGPYVASAAKHDVVQASYYRDARFCGTCHDVSNPAVGDLAHNHGVTTPLPGTFSGVPGGPVEDKAALNNPPHTYGVVERTFSEWIASTLDDLAVDDFSTLPADLTVVGGSLERAYQASLRGACSATTSQVCNVDANCPSGETCVTTTANFEDGATRTFTCQTCHMSPSGGKGAKQGDFHADLAGHDMTGGSYWIQDAVRYQDTAGTLLFGDGITTSESEAMDAAQARAENHLRSAASVTASQAGSALEVTVTNLTGHKLISGYPEGRRMWLHLAWKDSGNAVIAENGAYGPLGNVVPDLASAPFDVQSILDPSSTRVYQAKPGMTQEWASQLMSLGYDPGMVLEWDRTTNLSGRTLGDLASESPGTVYPTFHFALNNAIYHDNRIPPFGFDHDIAVERNILPVPQTQFGGPGPGGSFDHFDVVSFPIPVGAASVEVHLYYQSTSWEYVQFLWKQNAGLDPFLGNEGVNFLDAWLNSGMGEPFEMAETSVSLGAALTAPGPVSEAPAPPMQVTSYDPVTGQVGLSYQPACGTTGHTLHYGNLAQVSTYGWDAADCTFDTSGVALFTPDPVVGESLFWVLVGHNADFEGSYGAVAAGERPANTGAAGSCFRPQNPALACE